MTVQELLDALGGTANVARAIDRPLSSVASWAHRGNIPDWRMPAVAAMAKEMGVEVPDGFDKPVKAA